MYVTWKKFGRLIFSNAALFYFFNTDFSKVIKTKIQFLLEFFSAFSPTSLSYAALFDLPYSEIKKISETKLFSSSFIVFTFEGEEGKGEFLNLIKNNTELKMF